MFQALTFTAIPKVKPSQAAPLCPTDQSWWGVCQLPDLQRSALSLALGGQGKGERAVYPTPCTSGTLVLASETRTEMNKAAGSGPLFSGELCPLSRPHHPFPSCPAARRARGGGGLLPTEWTTPDPSFMEAASSHFSPAQAGPDRQPALQGRWKPREIMMSVSLAPLSLVWNERDASA